MKKRRERLLNTGPDRRWRICRWLAPCPLWIFLLTVTAAWPQARPAGAAARGGRGIQPDTEHPIMAIGTLAPDFALPGIDGKIHRLREYASAKVLAIAFECNHCPVSQIYEGRIKRLYQDYKDKGVALVAINRNNPKSVRLNELGYTDLEDSLPEMKIRAENRHITWPYLYDGQTQTLATKFGVVATPHIFIFDQDRKLRYEGHIDDNQVESLAKAHDARDAIEALLAGKPVAVTDTRAFGCSTKWLSKATGAGSREEEMKKIQAEPVKLDMAGAGELKRLRTSAPDKVLVVMFWSTRCPDCAGVFHDLETTYRMYRQRAFQFVTVSTDAPLDRPAVMAFLQKQYASGPNLQFATNDKTGLQAAFGAKWKMGTPYTVVIAPDGKEVLYEKEGKIDLLALRRTALANMADTRGYPGNQAYWAEK
jgi:peroxiredoxin